MANIPFLNNAYFAAKVGIGTASPGNPLHVYSSDNILATFESTDGISEIRIKDNTKYTRLLTVGGHFKIMPNDGVEMAVFQGDTGRTLFNAGNVGIGTTTPNASLQIGHAVATSSEKLDVRGNSSGNYIASFEQDHITGYGVLIDTDGTLVSEPALKIKNQSSELFYVGSNGNVGIGTTSPTSPLTIKSNSTSSSSSGLTIQSNGNTNNIFELAEKSGDSARLQMMDAGVTKIALYTDGTDNYINSGNVGIGTTSPGAKLEVNGVIRVEGGTYVASADTVTNAGIVITEDDYIYTKDGGNLRKLIGKGGDVISIGQSGTSLIDGISFLSGLTPLYKWYNNASEIMRLNATGLGIGTTSPTSKLDIRQSTSGGSDVLGTGAITIGSDNPYWTLRGTATSLQDLAFDRNYSGTWYESMRIQRSTGNIGIGTTSPTAKLHVAGTGLFTGLVSGITPVAAANFVTKAYVDGSGGGTGPFLPLAGGTMTGTSGVVFPDSFKLNLGTGSDLEILHDGADSIINNNLGHLYITQTADDKDIIFRSDDGSGGVTEYLFLDGSQTNVNFQKDAIFTDGIKALFGGSGDLQIYHDGSNSYVNEVGAGDLYLQTNGTNMFLRDNSSGNTFIAMNTGTADVVLKQGGATRLTTTSTGVTVTGAATATTFLGDLNGTINTATTAVTKANATNDTTVATTAFVQNLIGTIPAGLVFQGTWNAATNTPTLTSGSGTTGHFYIVSTDGSTNLDGITDWKVGDWAVFVEQGASDQWEKIDNSSVLDGFGTGGTVAAWAGSGTSNTLTNSPITFSGNNVSFAGNITVVGNQYFNGEFIEGDGKEMFRYSDGWLRINEDNDFGSGIYCGTGLLRTDGEFQIGGSGQYAKITSTGSATFAGSIDTTAVNIKVGSAIHGTITSSSNSLTLNARNTGHMIFQSGGSEKMRIANGGNVGIGTTSPSRQLDVEGVIRFSSNSNQAVNGYGEIYTTYSYGKGQIFIAPEAVTSPTNFHPNGGVTIGPANTSPPANGLIVSGNVGIGTSGPISKFTVTGTDNTNQANIGHSTQSVFIKVNGTNVDYNASGNSSGSHTFSTGNAERMRITAAGILMVGGTTGGYSGTKIHVGNFTDTQNGINILTSTTGYGYVLFGDGTGADTYRGQITYYHGDDSMSFNTNGSEKLRIVSGGGISFAGATNFGSAGQVLKSNGSASPTWIDGSAIPGVPAGSGTLNTVAMWTPDGDTLGDSPITISGNNATFAGTVQATSYKIGGVTVLQGTSTVTVGSGGGTGKVQLNTTSGVGLILDGSNVGIGTTTPSKALHVSDSNDAPFRVESTDSTTGIQFKDPDGNNNIYYVGNGDYFYTSANVGIGTTSPSYKLTVSGGGIQAGGKITYTKSAGSLDTTGYAVAGLTTSSNGQSAGFTFTCFGHTGGYQKIVYSCYNGGGTWVTKKVINEGTNQLDVVASANGTTITFTFKSISGTMSYTPRVTVEAVGTAINSTYA